ncbi:SEA (Seh1-associated) complex subunit [Cadophora gregata]|uniref:SEA (Seh1-associated) complex subunit n=1 Tax=Cadophora gregata TaxID=51156 RepID=UPI0026DA80A7|nr:SEA (Seh1-associated) complex subunit [Cadophora gregata]KAK0104429.1 SEA (Seh1-associated) complex subunit [Cadophora gregata]
MNTKSNIMRKLLRQPTATSTPNENVDTSTLDSPQLRPSASQHTVYSAGVPINCVDRSPDGLRAVVAGSKIFKILRIDGPTITEELDLRAIIISYANSHDPSAATPEQLNIRAVKWSWGDLDSYIITACGNGRITVYDLNRRVEGLEVGRIQEHARQVHKLDISPFRNNWLLSASHDGTVRSWDLKTLQQGRHGLTFKALATFKCNAEAVRDVKWSPTDGMEFACCTDAGVIQKWDIRKVTAPVLKLSAHSSACFSISWHPDGGHLISGGIDQYCHVWDLSKTGDRSQKPRYTFMTPAPVSRVSWRPACWSATAQGKRAAQVTVAYDDSNPGRNQTSMVHIWDLARSALPFKEVEQWNSAPTSLVWNSRDLLWSVDKEGHFTQTDVAFVHQLIERRSLSTLAFSPMGDVLMMLEARQVPKRSRPSITSPESSPGFKHSGSGPLLSVSRSDSEEDVVGSFLGPRLKKGHRRRHSGRGQSLSTTPPTSIGFADNKVMPLDEAVKITGTYKPQQVMAIGHAPSTAKRTMYQYFTNRYLMRLDKKCYPELYSQSANIRATMIMESYGRTAENVGYFRLAQTWRLLSYTMNLLLSRRAEFHRQSRLQIKAPSNEEPEQDPTPESRAETDRGEETPRRLPRPQQSHESALHRHGISMIQEDIESTSNVATPLVRPVRDHIVQERREAMHTPIVIDDDLVLPEAVHPKTPSPIPVPGAKQPPQHSSSSVEGYDFYGLDSFSPTIDFAAPVKKAPLRLEYHEPPQKPVRIQPQRHDSAESFQMFSTSADSHGSKFLGSSDSDRQSVNQDDRQRLRDRVANWENDHYLGPRHRQSIDSDAPTDGSSPGHLTPESQQDRDMRNGLPESPSSPPLPPTFRLHEASAPRGIDTTPVKNQYQMEEPISPTTSEKMSEDPNIIESDFLPWPNDPEFLIKPIDPTVLAQRAIDFEAQTSALNAAVMVLLLRPLLPSSAIDGIQAGAILRQYHLRLTSMKLFTEAALLRNLCVPQYPAVFAPAQEDIKIGFYCTDCNKPLENDPLIPGSVWKCPRCRKFIDPCTICQHRDLPDTSEYETDDIEIEAPLWWLCPGCGHGGHGACMQAWHAGAEYEEGEKYSDGCCPLEGCLHPCLPGSWREQRAEEKKAVRAREMDALVRENARHQGGRGGAGRVGTPVRRDGREVKQSQAVEGVRVALGVNGLSSHERGVGIGGLERKKSVKLVAPGEEG